MKYRETFYKIARKAIPPLFYNFEWNVKGSPTLLNLCVHNFDKQASISALETCYLRAPNWSGHTSRSQVTFNHHYMRPSGLTNKILI